MQQFKLLTALCLLLATTPSYAGSDDVDNALHLISNFSSFFMNDGYITIGQANQVTLNNTGHCEVSNNSVCQSSAGVNTVQIATKGDTNHKVVSVVTGNGDVQSTTNQYTKTTQSIQDCSGITCVQIIQTK